MGMGILCGMGMGILRPTFQKKRKFPLAKPEEVVYNIIVARSGHADIAQQVERILGKDMLHAG